MALNGDFPWNINSWACDGPKIQELAEPLRRETERESQDRLKLARDSQDEVKSINIDSNCLA